MKWMPFLSKKLRCLLRGIREARIRLGKHLFFALSVAVHSSIVVAAPLTEPQVKAALETWIRLGTASPKPDAVIEKLEPVIDESEVAGYITHIQGGGFCIGGADTLLLPCYLYVTEGQYDPANPNYQVVIIEIKKRLKHYRQGMAARTPAMTKHQQLFIDRDLYWNELIAGRVPPPPVQTEELGVVPVTMDLGITSRWRQGGLFNDLCPVLTPPNEHTVTGCVATAMAQVMYYWRWPNNGVGSGSGTYNHRFTNVAIDEALTTDPGIPVGYPWDSDSDGVNDRLWWSANRLNIDGFWDGSMYERALAISGDADYRSALATLYGSLNLAATGFGINFGLATYNWNVMTDTGGAEEAEISYHSGVAVGMDYGVVGSSADTLDVPSALEANFQYDTDGTSAYRGSSMVAHLVEEIRWLRPPIMAGQVPNVAGHAWVVCGYDDSGADAQFLMNFGWGGGCAQWYTIDTIDPIDVDGDGIPDNFNSDQKYVRFIAPDEGVKFVGAADPGDGTPNDPYENIEEAIAEAANNTTLIFKAGSENTFSAATLTINKPLTLKAYDASIQ